MAVKMDDIVGWYDLSWKGGSFEVCFRPAGKFFAPKFQAGTKWELEGDTIKIEWGKFGQYEMKFNPADKSMTGNALPKKDVDTNWRTAAYKRPLSDVEVVLGGDGAGTEWELEWSGGHFPVQFKVDGYNHFKCDDFPAHAHWSLDGDKLRINWGEYGSYDLVVDAEAKTMDGCAVGGDPKTDWRKGKLNRNLIDQHTIEQCEHH